MGGTYTTSGTHLHDKILGKYTVGFPDAAEELSLNVNRLRWTEPTSHCVEREVGDFLWRFPSRHHQNRYYYYATTDPLQPVKFNNTTVLHPTRSSTTSPFFTQTVVLDNYRLHQTRSSTVLPDIRIHQLDTYNNWQQPSVRLRHTCIFDSFHQSQ